MTGSSNKYLKYRYYIWRIFNNFFQIDSRNEEQPPPLVNSGAGLSVGMQGQRFSPFCSMTDLNQ